MGQTLWCYDFCWITQCNGCVGISYGLMCCNCWICVPDDVRIYRQPNDCFHCGGIRQGCGGTYCCYGSYCCIPDWMQAYSIRKTIGDKRPYFHDIQIVDKPTGPGSAQGLYHP
jgi:hypothetical protein